MDPVFASEYATESRKPFQMHVAEIGTLATQAVLRKGRAPRTVKLYASNLRQFRNFLIRQEMLRRQAQFRNEVSATENPDYPVRNDGIFASLLKIEDKMNFLDSFDPRRYSNSKFNSL